MDLPATPEKGRSKFGKDERLKSKKLIDKLFAVGTALNIPPIRVIFLPDSGIPQNQVLFTVPKKNYKKAVDRNRLKRQLREAYRLNKHHLLDTNSAKLLIAYIYNRKGDRKPAFAELEAKVLDSLQRLNKVIEGKRKES